MPELAFYHLTRSPLDQALAQLLGRSVANGWRCLVKTGAPEKLGALSDRLWDFGQGSFLAHGIAQNSDLDQHQPILLADHQDPKNGAEVLMVIEAADFDPADIQNFKKVCLIFDSGSGDQMDHARLTWTKAKEMGQRAIYWSQETGKWEKKLEIGQG